MESLIAIQKALDVGDSPNGDFDTLIEEHHIVRFFWKPIKGDTRYEFKFGKRAVLYFKCRFDNQCCISCKRSLSIKKVDGKRNLRTFFRDNSDTIVIEERKDEIVFYSDLLRPDKLTSNVVLKRGDKTIFSIDKHGDTGVACKDTLTGRRCAYEGRVLYVTFKGISRVDEEDSLQQYIESHSLIS